MIIETERLTLRPWGIDDANDLYQYAKDPKVGPSAGWRVHTSIDESKYIIENILSEEGTFAVELKETKQVIGSIGVLKPRISDFNVDEDEFEMGYWIGVPYWGMGLIPEAVTKLLEYLFEVLNASTIWCGYYDGNNKSRRVQEKCGFSYHHTEHNKMRVLMGDKMDEHYSRITREEYFSKKNKERLMV